MNALELLGPGPLSALRAAGAGLSVLLALGCAGTGGPELGGADRGAASEAEWRALAAPRPQPLPGAARLALGQVDLLGEVAWSPTAPVPASLGILELAAAGLLRRRDVEFVERRRFSAAVDRERSGASRPAGAPPAGVSPGAELTANVAWVPLGAGQASLEVWLVSTATGQVAATRRATLPAAADPVSLARLASGTVLAALRELGRLPAWSDSLPGSAPTEYTPSNVPPRAVADFLRGLAAEEAWRWDAAREAYQAAARAPGFVEASAALARTARLRLGGTLGES